jgi:endonuclease-3
VSARAARVAGAAGSGDPARAAGELLAELGATLDSDGAAQVGGSFTPLAEADHLVKTSPEAFLLGVLFTQGVPAERAWAGPWLLRDRLGHLDLVRLAAERAAVDAAVCAPPALHRFKHTVAGWVSDAAERLLDCYGGDATRIWAGGASTAEVADRLASFRGIGRKKSAMAVEILRRHFGVEMTGPERGTVAYDVHVRRVFLRTGLATSDTPDAIARAAREACPECPGTLDLPAWLVGRTWCRPTEPRCDACPLAPACARVAGVVVEGVGARRR